MRQPITKNVIKNSPEGPDVFDMEWVHQGLALIINNNEKNPGEAKEKNQTIKNEKGRETTVKEETNDWWNRDARAACDLGHRLDYLWCQ